MGMKFYRSGDKGEKVRKRFEQTRSWFRTFKWVSYHAHPTMIPGHPFKGGCVMSTGQLLHPDVKRFGLTTPILFKPPTPGNNPYEVREQAPAVPSFDKFF